MKNQLNNCVVVVPTHKPNLEMNEEKSLINTLNVLASWDVVLLLKSGVSTEYYDNFQNHHKLYFKIVIAHPDWMGSIEKYNEMSLSPSFYNLFNKYTYLLVCHLDAWVFRDEIQVWIDKDYHYVGAPWFIMRGNKFSSLEHLMLPYGGNGGFSLRRIDKMIELTTKVNISINLNLFLKGLVFLLKNKKLKYLKIYIKAITSSYFNLDNYRKKHAIYEDVVFSIFFSFLDKGFRVAPAKEAILFATEVYSEEIINTMIKWRLPVAIHAYDKYFKYNDVEEYSKNEARNSYSKVMNYSGSIENKVKNIMPLVTIVTATYNIIQSGRLQIFKQCMDSIHEQTYSNIEHVIIDGGSSDGTLEIIDHYVKKGLCICYSETDDGVWDAMYKGQEKAHGYFINFMNSDDYFARADAVEIAVNKLLKKKADWFFSEGDVIREDGTSYRFPTSPYGVFSCGGIIHQTMFIKTDILRAINPFKTTYITRENYLMMVLIINNFNFAFSKKVLVNYRLGGFSTGEYCGSNLQRTQTDFSKYFHSLVGRSWGMSEAECGSMFGRECLVKYGVRYSYNLTMKLHLKELRRWFRKQIVISLLRDIPLARLKFKNFIIKISKSIFFKV